MSKKILIPVVVIAVFVLSALGYVAYNLEPFSKIKDSGIGVRICDCDCKVLVGETLDNMPAKKLGIESGDIIVAVNNKAITTVDEGVNLMRGKTNSVVKISTLKNGEKKDYIIFRKKIKELEEETTQETK